MSRYDLGKKREKDCLQALKQAFFQEVHFISAILGVTTVT